MIVLTNNDLYDCVKGYENKENIYLLILILSFNDTYGLLKREKLMCVLFI